MLVVGKAFVVVVKTFLKIRCRHVAGAPDKGWLFSPGSPAYTTYDHRRPTSAPSRTSLREQVETQPDSPNIRNSVVSVS